MLYAIMATAPLLTVAGLTLILPARAARRGRRLVDEQLDDDQMRAFLAAIRPGPQPPVECPDLKRLRRARQLGRADLRLAHQRTARAA